MLQNNTKSVDLKIDRKDISYLRWTVESYDGMGAVSTLEPSVAMVRIHLAPGCEQTLINLLSYMSYNENITIDLESVRRQLLVPGPCPPNCDD